MAGSTQGIRTGSFVMWWGLFGFLVGGTGGFLLIYINSWFAFVSDAEGAQEAYHLGFEHGFAEGRKADRSAGPKIPQ